MANSRPTVLLTGFGPFPSVPANAIAYLGVLFDRWDQQFRESWTRAEERPIAWPGVGL